MLEIEAGTSLAAALGLRDRELVALVSGGGKSSALRLLAHELSGTAPVISTTTTGMFLDELAATGPVVMAEEGAALSSAVRAGLRQERAVGAGVRVDSRGKVAGLPTTWVDRLWGCTGAPYLLVEADGSKGMPLKAFGPNEPQVPSEVTVIVQMVGLDAIGVPLDEAHVHRAELLAEEVGLAPGSIISVDALAACLRYQIRVLRRGWPRARVVTFLNKVEGSSRRVDSQAVALEMLCTIDRPDAVIFGSVREGRFARLDAVPEVSAIVLASGRSTRLGSQKVLLPLHGRALVEWVVDAALASKVEETIVVAGDEAEGIKTALGGRPVTLAVNPDPRRGMSSSMQAGIRAAASGCKAALFLLSDQPFVTPSLIDRIIDVFSETGSLIVRPSIAGEHRHPVLVSGALFPELLAQRGDVGGREVLERYRKHVRLVPVDDAFAGIDIDTSEDYEEARLIEAEVLSSRMGRR